jgi:3'(2'), 5'-bisphosphate nucleotidase
MAKPLQPELETAFEAAAKAGRLILEHYQRFVAISDARADITTQTDRDAQEVILQTLHGAFPSDGLRAEEQTTTLTQAPSKAARCWIVDPIDGTRGFAKKNGEFSVMVALIEHAAILLGVVLEPVANRITFATRGGGCWQSHGFASTANRCQVRSTERLADAILVQSHSRAPGGHSEMVVALSPTKVIETYSAGVKLALVARGEADLYLNSYPHFNDWDICAGQILVEEAGGKVSGLQGELIRYGEAVGQRSGLLASNSRLHDAALATLRALGASSSSAHY